jgi:hypothetical protein
MMNVYMTINLSLNALLQTVGDDRAQKGLPGFM